MPDTIDVNSLCMGCMTIKEHIEGPCPLCGFDGKNYEQSHHHLKLYTILNGKYLIGRALGEGGFGITYLGWDLNLDIRIAIKEYYPVGLVTRETTATGLSTVTPFTGNKGDIYQSGLEKFVKEAKSLAKFSNLPGIVSVKDFFRENGTAYIVMEYIEGITLKQHLTKNEGRISPDRALELMKPIMKSLSNIHSEGIIHRDISPDNIMLTAGGEVKLLDFGAARDFAGDGNKSLSVLLKPGYAPEEQYRTKGNQGPWTDVYAICATLYKMITGDTPPESLDRYGEETLIPPSAKGIILTAQTEKVLLKGLAVFQKDRYQSVDKLYQALYENAMDAVGEEGFSGTIEINRNKEAERDITVAIDSAKSDVITGISAKNNLLSKKKIQWFALAGAAVILFILAISFISGNRDRDQYAGSDVPSQGIGDTSENRNTHSATPIADDSTPVSETPTPTPLPATLEATPESLFNNGQNGNTTGNIANLALVAQIGDWIFYSAPSLCKLKVDGSEQTLVYESSNRCLNTLGDELFFIEYGNEWDDLTLSKIGANETMPTKVLEGVYAFHISGDWLYYTYAYDDYHLYRMKADGSEQEKLIAQRIDTFQVSGDWIYFTLDYGNIKKVRTDGSQMQDITSKSPNCFCVAGDWIYYFVGDGLMKIRIDGTEKQKLTDDNGWYINIDGDYIYYTNAYDDNAIYRIGIDGNGRQALNSDSCNVINIVDGWVYYSASMEGAYKMRTDGSDRQPVEVE